MARPNVTVSVVDNSFIVPGSEGGSPHVSGMYSNDLVTIFGTTADKNADYMTVSTVGEWVTLLNGTTYGGTAGVGPTGAWKTDWYSAYNYLLYGGTLLIAETTNAFFDTSIVLDTVFTSSLSDTQTTFVSNTVADRDDVIGIVGVTYQGYTGGTVPLGVTAYGAADSVSGSNIFFVGGEKVILGLSNTTVGENFVTIPLAGDAAGCFARTDRISERWFSPAGTTRGRVLNTIRLIKNPKDTEQDRLYDDGDINSVIGIPGQGVFIFGDKTRESDDTSTLTRVNVVRLINYIKRTLGNTAKGVLFEVNDEITRSSFTNAANAFLQTIQDGRGLYEYKVVCDETNNPASIVDANQFVADVFIKPTKSINFVKLVITNVNTDIAL